MKKLQNICIICKNTEEFQQVFLILSTYFNNKTICINSFFNYSIIFIVDNSIHGAKTLSPLLTSYPELIEISIEDLLNNY